MIELADTSAWGVLARIDEAARRAFDEAVVEGRLGCCGIVMAEILFSAIDASDYATTRRRLELLPFAGIHDAEWARAFDVWGELAGRGPLHHRQVKFNDVLVAVAAEAAGASVLHYDRDFDRIAEVTGQAVRAIVPIGSL